MWILRTVVICLLLGANVWAEGVPDNCTQLIFGVAPTWNSMSGELRLFERPRHGQWTTMAGPFPVLFGKNGLAWGTGVAGAKGAGLCKKEGDRRATARTFRTWPRIGYESPTATGAGR